MRVREAATHLKLREQVTNLQRALDAAVSLHQVPIELCHTLRAPDDATHVVDLFIGGRSVRAVVRPIGHVDPERELAIWHEILAAADEHTLPGRYLRPMEAQLLAIGIADAMVVNTVHPRHVARAAIRMLQAGTLTSLAAAWLSRHSQRRSVQVSGAILSLVAVGSLTLVSADKPMTNTPGLPPLAVSASPTSALPSRSVTATPPPPTREPEQSGEPDRPSSTPPPAEPSDTGSPKRPTSDDRSTAEADEAQPADDQSDEPNDRQETPGPTLTDEPAASPRQAPTPTGQPVLDPPSTSAARHPSRPPLATPPPPSTAVPQCHLLDVDLLNLTACL